MAPQRYRRAPDVVFDTVAGQAMLLDGDGTHLISLNASGTIVWNELATPKVEDELVDALQVRFPTTARGRLRRDCSEFLNSLVCHGLVDALG